MSEPYRVCGERKVSMNRVYDLIDSTKEFWLCDDHFESFIQANYDENGVLKNGKN
jgi:hypothetical protein